MSEQVIRLVLKENTKTDKDTKEGEHTTYKVAFAGNVSNIEVGLTLKTEEKGSIDDITPLKLGQELFIRFVPDPQTKLDTDNVPLNKEKPERKKGKGKGKKEGTEEHIIDAEHRLMPEQKKIGAGGDENVLSEISA